jgi:hypothetical protein
MFNGTWISKQSKFVDDIREALTYKDKKGQAPPDKKGMRKRAWKEYLNPELLEREREKNRNERSNRR